MHHYQLYILFIAMLRMSGALAKSTDVMKAMGSLIRIPEIQATMRELSKEMTKVLDQLLDHVITLNACIGWHNGRDD